MICVVWNCHYVLSQWASLNPGVWLEIPDDADAFQTVRETPGKRQDAAPTPVVVDQGIMCALRQAGKLKQQAM